MDATAWTVVAATIVILGAIATAFRSLRVEMRDQRVEMRAQGRDLRERLDAQGEDLRNRIAAQSKELGEQIGQLRERMAHLEGLLEGLREAITGKRAA